MQKKTHLILFLQFDKLIKNQTNRTNNHDLHLPELNKWRKIYIYLQYSSLFHGRKKNSKWLSSKNESLHNYIFINQQKYLLVLSLSYQKASIAAKELYLLSEFCTCLTDLLCFTTAPFPIFPNSRVDWYTWNLVCWQDLLRDLTGTWGPFSIL